MLRTTVLSTTALLGLGLVAPTTAAHAAGETCHGQAATHVGDAQTFRLVGTEGPDVIVTNGAHTIEALGGDDVICVTGFGSQVYAGDGNDLVDGSAIQDFGAQVRLGAGNDRFIGGPAFEVVWGGNTVDDVTFEQMDTEDDVIDMGPANANDVISDLVRSGQEGRPNGDVVRVDRGAISWWGVPTPTTRLDGGGDATVELRAAHPLAIDTRTGTAAFEGQGVVPFSGFTRFTVDALEGARTFSFQGSAADEELELHVPEAIAHSVDMAGGDDELWLIASGRKALRPGTWYDGGPGRDLIHLSLPSELDADLHLGRGRLSVGPGKREVTVRARRFEDAAVAAQDVEVVGTAGPNNISTKACVIHVDGRAGKDRIDDDLRDPYVSLGCKTVSATFLGGTGNDTLIGSRGHDRLFGGPGRDKADGAGGRDVCSAERVRRCEKRI